MAHPEIQNYSGYAFEPLFLADEEQRPLIVCVIKATFDIVGNSLQLASEQVPIHLTGTPWGEPEISSYKFEPEVAFTKVTTDVVMIGHAYPPQPGSLTVDVGLKVGPVQKVVRVFGERYWVKAGGRVLATKPKAIDRIPLIYERAYGGWDKASRDEAEWRCDSRNPVGISYGDPLRYVEEGKVPMPNLEDPNDAIRRYGDVPRPAGFGFISPHWQPRAQFAGTYDKNWNEERKPLLPTDFDRRFFNAASPGLIAPNYLRGDEDVVVVNASSTPQLRFRLPGAMPPQCRVGLRGRRTIDLQTNLDTVIVNTDDMQVCQIWRTFAVVPNGPHDVLSIEVMQGQPGHGPVHI